MSKIVIKEGVKEQLLKGAEILYDAVSTTLGPKGLNAVIEVYGEPLVTHDGVTVANSIEIDDGAAPAAKIGLEMVKVSSKKNNDNVGDGTTTATVLAYHIARLGVERINRDFALSPMVLRKEIEAASEEALKYLDKATKPVATEQDAISVATISSQNKEVGEIVGKLFYKLGKDAQVSIEQGYTPGIESEVVEGYSFDRGIAYPHMIMDPKTQSTTLVAPAILISSVPIGITDVYTVTQSLYNNGVDELFIIADDIKQDLLTESSKKKGTFNFVHVRAPGFGEHRLELLEDIAKLTKTKVYDGKTSLAVADLGMAEKVIASPSETVIYGAQDISEYVATLETRLKKETSEYEKEKLTKRIAQLKSSVGIIRVGGLTEMAHDELNHLVTDAVCATQSAMKEGFVPGSGVTYLAMADAVKSTTEGAKILKEALQYPFNILLENSGQRPGVVKVELSKHPEGTGMNVLTGKMVDLVEEGIIDSVSVVKNAVKNAVSVAGSILTTGVAITNKKEDKSEEEEI